MESLSDLNGLRVIVVDDSTDNLELVEMILAQYHAQVTAVTSASEAFEIITHLQPDILLCDLMMPNEDGYWLIRQIRNHNSVLKQIPALAITALASKDERPLIFESGFSEILYKPFYPEELIAVVWSLYHQPSSHPSTLLDDSCD
jgi:CheY-like chemotaxis protein